MKLKMYILRRKRSPRKYNVRAKACAERDNEARYEKEKRK